ncbi:sensor histidine kinase [Actinotalea sp.]|uniref:sensor histidine kinase n=1 Tax=Actinotalea sp. TaxID=1872145 RepID=UPI00356180D1
MGRTTGTAESATAHAERAFQSASALSLSISLTAAVIASAGVSIFLARRVRRSLAPLSNAAHRVASGERDVQVDPPGLGAEFDELAEAFTAMAKDLATIEATRTRMLADLAHEMRTPTSVLRGYLEAIGDGFEVADAGTVRMLQEQVERLARLGEDIALVTTAEEGRLTQHRVEVDMNRLALEAVTQAAGRYAAAGVHIRADRASQAAVVHADPDRIAQVLTNLLDNALRHTPPGGQVTVHVAVGTDAVSIAVTDTGQGIPAEHLARVFERFYRVDAARDRAHGGSGIGLAIAQAIAKDNAGTLRAQSPGVGGGSTFSLHLPRIGTSDAGADQPGQARPTDPGQRRRK